MAGKGQVKGKPEGAVPVGAKGGAVKPVAGKEIKGDNSLILDSLILEADDVSETGEGLCILGRPPVGPVPVAPWVRARKCVRKSSERSGSSSPAMNLYRKAVHVLCKLVLQNGSYC